MIKIHLFFQRPFRLEEGYPCEYCSCYTFQIIHFDTTRSFGSILGERVFNGDTGARVDQEEAESKPIVAAALLKNPTAFPQKYTENNFYDVSQLCAST